jgi:filamentous hemagglutinin family protein
MKEKIIAALIAAMGTAVHAAPTGGSFAVGSGTIGVAGSTTTVTAAPGNANSLINWSSFGVANGETVTFTHGGANHRFVSVDTSGSASQINGLVQATGADTSLYLVNPNGINVGAGGQVVASGALGLIAGNVSSMPAATDEAGSISFALNASPVTVQGGALVSAGGMVDLRGGRDISVTGAGSRVEGGEIRANAGRNLTLGTGAVVHGVGGVELTAAQQIAINSATVESFEQIDVSAGTMLAVSGISRIESLSFGDVNLRSNGFASLATGLARTNDGNVIIFGKDGAHFLFGFRAIARGVGDGEANTGRVQIDAWNGDVRIVQGSVLDGQKGVAVYSERGLFAQEGAQILSVAGNLDLYGRNRAYAHNAVMRADTGSIMMNADGWGGVPGDVRVEGGTTMDAPNGDISLGGGAILIGNSRLSAGRDVSGVAQRSFGGGEVNFIESPIVNAGRDMYFEAAGGQLNSLGGTIANPTGVTQLRITAGRNAELHGDSIALGRSIVIADGQVFVFGSSTVKIDDNSRIESFRPDQTVAVSAPSITYDNDAGQVQQLAGTANYINGSATGSEGTDIRIAAQTGNPGDASVMILSSGSITLRAGSILRAGEGQAGPVTINYTIQVNNGSSTYGDTPVVTYSFVDDNGNTYSAGEFVALTGVSLAELVLAGVPTSSSSVGSYAVNLGSLAADGYSFLSGSDALWNVLPRELTVSASSAGKIYGQVDPVLGFALTGGSFVNGDALSGSLTRAAGENVGTYQIGQGALTAGSNYNITFVPGVLTIDPAVLSIASGSMTAAGKVYDGTTAATVTGAILEGVVGGDSVTVDLAGAFADKNIGIDKTVTVTGTLSGAEASNYVLAQTEALSADISPATISIAGLTAQDKTYDGTTAATTSGAATLTGAITGDDLTVIGGTTGTFADKNAGMNKPVTTDLTLSGADASNYRLELPELTANIERAVLTVTANGDAKVADGVPYAGGNGIEYSGFVAGEGVEELSGSLSYSGSSQGATEAGVYSIVPTGLDAANYELTPVAGELTITAAPIAEPPVVPEPPVEPEVPIEPALPPIEPEPVITPAPTPVPALPAQAATPVLTSMVVKQAEVEVPTIRGNEILVPAQTSGRIEVRLNAVPVIETTIAEPSAVDLSVPAEG